MVNCAAQADVCYCAQQRRQKSYDGQLAVRLCNYTHVYYNDKITEQIEFMPATATAEGYEEPELQRMLRKAVSKLGPAVVAGLLKKGSRVLMRFKVDDIELLP